MISLGRSSGAIARFNQYRAKNRILTVNVSSPVSRNHGLTYWSPMFLFIVCRAKRSETIPSLAVLFRALSLCSPSCRRPRRRMRGAGVGVLQRCAGSNGFVGRRLERRRRGHRGRLRTPPPGRDLPRRGRPRPAEPQRGRQHLLAPAASSRPARSTPASAGWDGSPSASGPPASGPSPCCRAGMRASDRRVVRRLGTFAGTISFEGEDGYTDGRRRPAPWARSGRRFPAAAATRGRAGPSPSPRPVPPRSRPRARSSPRSTRRAGSSFRADDGPGGVAFRARSRNGTPTGSSSSAGPTPAPRSQPSPSPQRSAGRR